MNNYETKPCAICGKEFPRIEMEMIFTGRRHYVCRSCAKRGQIDVGVIMHGHYTRHQKKLNKE